MRQNVLLLALVLGLCLVAAPSHAVSVYLQNGMQITTYITAPAAPDTNSMSRVVVYGDVYDFGRDGNTGRLLGRVSCSNYNASVFAGVTMPANTRNGIITRFTMPWQYPFNTPSPNFVRWYRVANRGANITNATMAFAYNASETNGVTTPYAMKRWYSSAWTEYTNGAGGDNGADGDVDIVAATIPGSGTSTPAVSDWIYVHYEALVTVYARVMLEGAWDASNTQPWVMKQNANFKTALMARDPGLTPFALNATNPPTYLTITNPTAWATRYANNPDIIDWIELHLRSTIDGTSVIAGQGFVDKNGYIMGEDGLPGVDMGVPNGNYWIVVVHPNHLPAQSKNAVNTATLTGYGTGDVYFDFANIDNVLNAHRPAPNNNNGVLQLWKLVGGLPQLINFYGLIGGNGGGRMGSETGINDATNAPVISFAQEYSAMLPVNTLQGYYRQDHTLNGVVSYGEDINPTLRNNLLVTQIRFPLR